MKIISFAAVKGGVGKTTLCFNFGEWLSSLGKSVLLIDTDHQCSLSQTYGVFKHEGTSYFMFEPEGEVDIYSVHENLDLIPASPQIDDLEKSLSIRHNKDLLLMMWFTDNYERIKNYDYILFDCHPDFQTVTKNALIVSHAAISPIEPSQYGFTSKEMLEQRLEILRKEVIDPISRNSYVTVVPFFIGNRMRHNTKATKELYSQIKDDPSVIANIPEKELFNRSTLDNVPIVAMCSDPKLKSKHKSFFKEVEVEANKILDAIDATA